MQMNPMDWSVCFKDFFQGSGIMKFKDLGVACCAASLFSFLLVAVVVGVVIVVVVVVVVVAVASGVLLTLGSQG